MVSLVMIQIDVSINLYVYVSSQFFIFMLAVNEVLHRLQKNVISIRNTHPRPDKPSSSDEALLSPHSALTSFIMRLNLLVTLASRISAWVLVGNLLLCGKSRPFCTAKSSSSCNKKYIKTHRHRQKLRGCAQSSTNLKNTNTFLETRICFSSLW